MVVEITFTKLSMCVATKHFILIVIFLDTVKMHKRQNCESVVLFSSSVTNKSWIILKENGEEREKLYLFTFSHQDWLNMEKGKVIGEKKEF